MAKTLLQSDAPKPIGRPRADEPGSAVTTWLKQSEHDRLAKLAAKHEVTISKLVRSLLIMRLR